MNKGGRKKDPIWECFDEVSIGGKSAAKCKRCGHVQSNKAARMKVHISSNCVKKITNEYLEELPLSSSRPTDVTKNNNSLNNSEHGENIDQPPSKKVCLEGSSNMNKFVSKTSLQDKNKIDLVVAKLFYACNIPFAVVESEAFKNLIHILRPSYKPPSRKQLSSDLLDAVNTEMEQLVNENLGGKEGTLVIDGFSNIRNEPITASCIQVCGKSYIVDAEATGATKKTAEFLVEKCKNAISTAQNKYGCQIKSIVSDNAKNMEKMRSDLELQISDGNPWFISYGCGAHWMNLLGDDITPSSLIKHVVDINKYFRNHHAPGSWLRQCSDSVTPKLPGKTRWNSQLICLESFVRNHNSYIKISNEHFEEMELNIVNRIRDFNLYQQVKDLIKQLKTYM